MSNHKEYPATFHGVVFTIHQWIESDNSSYVELSALAESQYLYYPGSSLVPVELSATVRTSHLISDLFPLVESALAKA